MTDRENSPAYAALPRSARRVFAARAHPLSHGHQVTRDHLRRIDPGGGRPGNESTQGSRPACRRGWRPLRVGDATAAAITAGLWDSVL